MKITYDQQTDTLYLVLTNKTIVETDEIQSGFLVDYDADKNIVGIEILFASQKVDNPMEMIFNFVKQSQN